MPTTVPPIDEDALLAIIDQHRHPTGQVNSMSLAKAIGRPRSTVQGALTRLALQGRIGGPAPLPGFAIKQISEKTSEGIWVQQAPLGDKLELQPGEVYKERSVLTDGDMNTKLVWHKLKQETEETALTREAIAEMFAEYRGKAEILSPPAGCDPTRIALLPTADIHLGLLAWGKDCARDWDLAAARQELLNSTSELIQLTPACQTAVLLDLGDQFHMNDQSNATPMHRHRLDVDGRFPKVAKAGVKIRRTMIDLALQRFERVLYRGLSGNHDPEAQMWLSIALAEFYENNPRVEIDTDPSEFWAYEFGKTFLFANHGHKVKPDRLPGLMASDHPEIWGRTTHKYCFSGHVHRERSGEELGVRWETLRTINPGDNYAHTGGWRAGHELTSITYSADTGQRHRQFVPV